MCTQWSADGRHHRETHMQFYVSNGGLEYATRAPFTQIPIRRCARNILVGISDYPRGFKKS